MENFGRHLGIGFHPAGNHDLGLAGQDLPGRVVDAVDGGPALHFHIGGGRPVSESPAQRAQRAGF